MSSLPKEEPMVTNETSESDRRFTDAAVATAELNANCKVLFEGEEEAPLFVNRELLAVYSVVFRAMFYGDFMETNTEMIKLTDVRRVDFLLFLSCLYAPAKPVEAKNLMAIWTLADGFECAVLMKECEQVVEKMRRPSSVEEFKNLIEFCDLRKWHDKMERLLEGANFSTISALLNETWLGSLDEKTRKIVSESVQSAYRPVVASTGVENGSEAVRPSVRLAAGRQQSSSTQTNQRQPAPTMNKKMKRKRDSSSSSSSSSTSTSSSSSSTSTSTSSTSSTASTSSTSSSSNESSDSSDG